MTTRPWILWSERPKQRAKDAAAVLSQLYDAGLAGSSGIAIRRSLQLNSDRFDEAIYELYMQGLIKEQVYTRPGVWACPNGFTAKHASKRRWRITARAYQLIERQREGSCPS